MRLEILDNTTTLPPSLLDINNLTPIFKTDKAVGQLGANFVLENQIIRGSFGKQYLTADVVRDQVETLSYSIMPWTIRSVLVDPDTDTLSLEAEPFQSSAKMYTPKEEERWIIMSDNSFTHEEPDVDSNGTVSPCPRSSGEKLWRS